MVGMLHSFANNVQVASGETQDDSVMFFVWPYLHLVKKPSSTAPRDVILCARGTHAQC